MATSIPYNLVRVLTSTTGTGSSMELGAAFSDAFLTAVESGAQDGDTVTYIVEQGQDREIGRGVLSASATTISRGTPLKSKVGVTAGTSKIDLDGTATVRFILSAEDLEELAQVNHGVQIFSSTGAAIATGGYPAARYVSAPQLVMNINAEITHGQSGDTVSLSIYKNDVLEYGPVDVEYGTPLAATDVDMLVARGDDIVFQLEATVGTPWGFWAQVD